MHQDAGAEEQRYGSTERQQVPDEAVSVPGEVVLAVDHVVVAAVEEDLVQEEGCRYQAVDNLQTGKIFGMTLQHLNKNFSFSLNCSPFQTMSMFFSISILNFKKFVDRICLRCLSSKSNQAILTYIIS